jgi:hypothetical protein
VARPALDLLVFKVGERQELPVVPDTPDDFGGMFRVSPFDNCAAGKQMIRQKGKISGLVRAGIEVIRESANDGSFFLDKKDLKVDRNRLDVIYAYVVLLPRE